MKEVNKVLKIETRPSEIDGRGSFATQDIVRGEVLQHSRGSDFIGFNHSCEPNVVLTRNYAKQVPVAVRAIKTNEELTVDYGWDGRPEFVHGKIGGKPCRCPPCVSKEK